VRWLSAEWHQVSVLFLSLNVSSYFFRDGKDGRTVYCFRELITLERRATRPSRGYVERDR
jgi:hypothetical protein